MILYLPVCVSDFGYDQLDPPVLPFQPFSRSFHLNIARSKLLISHATRNPSIPYHDNISNYCITLAIALALNLAIVLTLTLAIVLTLTLAIVLTLTLDVVLTNPNCCPN